MDLDIEQNHVFQRREWLLERIGWGLLTLFLLRGFSGLVGTGPLSWAATGDDTVRAEHDRVTHYGGNESVVLVLGADAVAEA